jgi:hypothetical protein
MASRCHSTAAPKQLGRSAFKDHARNYSRAICGSAQLSHTLQLWSENFDWKRSQRGSSFVTTRLVRQPHRTTRSGSSLQRERFPSVDCVQHARSRSITKILPTRSNSDEASHCSTRLATAAKPTKRSSQLSCRRNTMERGGNLDHQASSSMPSILAEDVCL